ncbi:polysaccharide lyase [Microlunatus antarcticus]
MSHARRSSRSRARRPRGSGPISRRLQVLLALAAGLVVMALVATAVVVLAGHERPVAAPPADPSGCAAMTVPVRYQVNPATRTGLFTTTASGATTARETGWTQDEGVLFRAATGPTPGLVAVHQLRKGEGDQLWTADADEVTEAVRSWGYVDQGVVAYVARAASPCTVQVQRFQAGGVHRYATTAAGRTALRGGGWAAEGSFYAARPEAAASPGPTFSGESDPPGETVIDARFDEETLGPVTPDSFIRAVGKTNRSDAEYDSMTYEREPQGRSRFVRTHLAAHRILDRNDAPGDGNVLVVPLEDQSRDSACVTYDVRFSPGFEVSAGGKLPGLLGVAPGVSPATPTGGGKTDHGWSGRVMWLGPKLFRFVRESGQPDLAVTYLYHPGQAGTFGDDVSWGRSIVDGTWHTLRQCYRLNTIGQADGRLQAWVDGVGVLDRSDVVYRTDHAVHVTHLDWSIFRGGDNDDWTASSGGDVDLDNLVVTVA